MTDRTGFLTNNVKVPQQRLRLAVAYFSFVADGDNMAL